MEFIKKHKILLGFEALAFVAIFIIVIQKMINASEALTWMMWFASFGLLTPRVMLILLAIVVVIFLALINVMVFANDNAPKVVHEDVNNDFIKANISSQSTEPLILMIIIVMLIISIVVLTYLFYKYFLVFSF